MNKIFFGSQTRADTIGIILKNWKEGKEDIGYLRELTRTLGTPNINKVRREVITLHKLGIVSILKKNRTNIVKITDDQNFLVALDFCCNRLTKKDS